MLVGKARRERGNNKPKFKPHTSACVILLHRPPSVIVLPQTSGLESSFSWYCGLLAHSRFNVRSETTQIATCGVDSLPDISKKVENEGSKHSLSGMTWGNCHLYQYS